ncbi:MAG: hypothetical protein M1817_004454 [Caeruleum heppii]|nr:MAG: hypothetical protein M1817_004454 [Caeruleum heppii]
MPPTIILVRHAQALHNVNDKFPLTSEKQDLVLTSSAQSYHIPDPPLTEVGLRQCSKLHESLKDLPIAQDVGLIVVSPMRRTIQTAQLGLQWLLEKGVPMDLRAEWQDLSFKDVDPLYPSKTGRYAFTQAAIMQRKTDCLDWLRARPEKVIAVVSHSGFLRIAVSNCAYENADYRVFGLSEPGTPNRLIEWDLTRERGGGLGLSPKGFFGLESQNYGWPFEVPDSDLGQELNEKEKEIMLGEVVQEIPA